MGGSLIALIGPIAGGGARRLPPTLPRAVRTATNPHVPSNPASGPKLGTHLEEVCAMKKILVTLATLAVSAGIALAGAGSAQANDDPGLCWNGWIWSACVSGPGWVDWNPGWGCNPGHGCGDWRHGGKHW